jgi:hypothetical protein
MDRQTTTAFNTTAIIVIAALFLVPVFILGQTRGAAPTATKAPTAAVPAQGSAQPKKAWVMPRTPDGQPDLQGYWTNRSYTGLERPANVTKPFYTQAELDAIIKRGLATDEQQTTPGTTADVHYDFTQFGLDRSQNPVAPDLRTSWITDPADGKIPAQTPQAQQRARDRAAAVKVPGAQYDSVQTIVVGSRCIIANPGPPLIQQIYNGNYQIIQSKDTVMILIEQIGDIRIIPLDGRPAPPSNVRQWMGVSRGHWDGDTLVVETTNFNERTEGRNRALAGISENFKLIERFKRTDENTFNYEFYVNDPDTFVKPWTASLPFSKIQGPIFEPACHEGNYGMLDTMKGARALDNQPAQAVAPAAPGRGGGRGAPARGQ